MTKTFLMTATALSLLLGSWSVSAVHAEDAENKAAVKTDTKEPTETKSKDPKGAKDKSSLQKLSDKQKNPPHFDNAFMLQTQNMLSMAIPEYRDALTADPKFISTYNNLAQCLWSRNEGKDREEARGLLNKAIAIDPKNVGTMYFLAVVKEDEKDVKAAETLYRRILSVQPLNLRTVANLSELMYRTGRKEEAKKVLHTALANQPPEPDVAVYKQALANLEKMEKAKTETPSDSAKKSQTKSIAKGKKSKDG